MLLPQMELFKDSDIINVVLVLFFSQEISSFKQISNHYLIRNQNWIFQVTKHTIYIRHSGRHLTPQSTFHFNLIRMNTIDHQQITSKTLRSCFLICHTPVDQDIDTTMTALIVAKWTRYSSATMMEARFPFFFMQNKSFITFLNSSRPRMVLMPAYKGGVMHTNCVLAHLRH